jgi:hypothetical protein
VKNLGRGARWCSACFGQYTDRDYIDFEAFFDGPMIEVGEGLKQPIDDLIICETCLKSAAKTIGLDYAKDLKDENRELGVAIEKREHTIREKDKMIADLTHTMDDMVKNPVKRPGGRPKVLTPS